jgi:hypothetical protein
MRSLFIDECARRTLHTMLLCVAMLGQGFTQEPSEQQRQADIRASVATVEKIINVLRPALFGNLTGAEAKIYKGITFHVSDQEALSRADSRLDDGTRIVEIDEGYGRQIEMMAEAEMIEGQQNRPVLIPYIQYVVLSWRQHATFIRDPSAFAHFDFEGLLDKPEMAKAWDKMSSNAIAFVIAHEVGHHVLGHCDNPLPKDPDKLRQMELDADAWAIERLEKATPHFSPLSGLLPLIFDYYITPKPIENETRSNHPADLRRIHKMFAAMERDLPDYRADIEKDAGPLGITYDQYSNFVKTSLRDYEQQMATDSVPVRDLPDASPESSSGSIGGSGFCQDLSVFVSAAAHHFSSLRGAKDPDGEGEAFYANHGIAGFSDCTIWIYKDSSLQPSATCKKTSGDFEGLRSSIAGCLTPGWSSTTRDRRSTKEYVFQGPNEISVRLEQTQSGKIKLWVDSPSRD